MFNEREEIMDKYTTFNTINSMLGKKYNFSLPLSDEARALICEHNSEQMYQIILSIYMAKDTGDEFVKKSIACVNKENKKIIGFGNQKD